MPVVVSDGDRTLVGVLSKKDLCKPGKTIQDVMTTPPIAARPDNKVADAACLMLKHKVRFSAMLSVGCNRPSCGSIMGCVSLDPAGMHIGCRCIVSLWLTAVQRWWELSLAQTSSQLLQASREASMSRWLFEELDREGGGYKGAACPVLKILLIL